MRKFSAFTLGILLFLTLISVGRAYGGEDEILAKVGNEVITRIDFETRLKSFPPALKETLKNVEKRKQLLDSMIKARLFVLEGGNRGLTEKPEIQARLKIIRDDFITQEYVKAYLEKKVEVSDEEAENSYNTNPEIREREYLKASQIVVEKEEEAKEILGRLKKGEPFKKLARERSIDKVSKNRDGELEWSEKGKGEKEIEEALSKLEKGGLSDVIKGKNGYYIYKLDDKRISPKLPYLKIREEIIAGLRYKKIAELAEKEVEELKKKISVETFYDKLTEMQ
jgi:peptidyl-prolyl cis-trans isomerase C